MLRVHRFRLLILSPLHIGGRFQVLFPFEYVIDGNRLVVVREDKLGKLLGEKGILSDFLRGFEQPGFSLTEYLKQKGLSTSQLLADIALYSCKLDRESPIGRGIRPFTRDAFQRPYLPGTALKGAMRTALWYHAIKSEPDRWLEKVREGIRKAESKKKVDDELDKEMFQGYRLNDKSQSPYTDILRVIRVRDSTPWERDSLRVGKELTFARRKGRENISVFLEYKEEAGETSVEVIFDEGLFERFKRAGKTLFDSFDDFLKKVDEFYRKVAEMELREGEEVGVGYYKWLVENTKGAGYLMRLGWGGGLHSLTVWLALPEDLKENIRRSFFRRSHRDKFPMTRRFLKRSEKGKDTYTPFGWVILKKEVGSR